MTGQLKCVGVLHAFFVILGGDQYDEEHIKERRARKEKELRDALSPDGEDVREVGEVRTAEEAKKTEGMGGETGVPTRSDPTTTPLPPMAASSKELVVADPTSSAVVVQRSDGTVTNPPARSD